MKIRLQFRSIPLKMLFLCFFIAASLIICTPSQTSAGAPTHSPTQTSGNSTVSGKEIAQDPAKKAAVEKDVGSFDKNQDYVQKDGKWQVAGENLNPAEANKLANESMGNPNKVAADASRTGGSAETMFANNSSPSSPGNYSPGGGNTQLASPSNYGSPPAQSSYSNPSSYASNASPGTTTSPSSPSAPSSPSTPSGATSVAQGTSTPSATVGGTQVAQAAPAAVPATPAATPQFTQVAQAPASSSGYSTPSFNRTSGGSGYFANNGSSGNSSASVRGGSDDSSSGALTSTSSSYTAPGEAGEDISYASASPSERIIDITDNRKFAQITGKSSASDQDDIVMQDGKSTTTLSRSGEPGSMSSFTAMSGSSPNASALDVMPKIAGEEKEKSSMLSKIKEFFLGGDEDGVSVNNTALADNVKINKMDWALKNGDTITIKCDDDVPFRVSFVQAEKNPIRVEAVNPVFVVENGKRGKQATKKTSVKASSGKGVPVVIESPGKNIIKIINLGNSVVTLSITRGDGKDEAGNIQIYVVEGKDGAYINISSENGKATGFFAEHPVLAYTLSSALTALLLLLLVVGGIMAYVYREKFLDKQIKQWKEFVYLVKRTAYRFYTKRFAPPKRRVL